MIINIERFVHTGRTQSSPKRYEEVMRSAEMLIEKTTKKNELLESKILSLDAKLSQAEKIWWPDFEKGK